MIDKQTQLSRRFLQVEVSPTQAVVANERPPSSSSRGSPYSNEANFDTNMVIILAALLCALICALGLNSIVRCALRCSRLSGFETPEELATRLAGTGLKKRALRQIPIAVYGSGGSGLASGSTECPICLGEFEDGEKVRVLPKCNHGFHVRCIDTWLVSHSSCPTCRHSLLEKPPPPLDAADVRPQGSGDHHTGDGDVVVIVDDVS